MNALAKLKATSRKLLLVTGRELDQLQAVFPEYCIFDITAAENGGLIYMPASQKTLLLGVRPPDNFIQILRDNGIPVSVDQVIVATWEPQQELVLAAKHIPVK